MFPYQQVLKVYISYFLCYILLFALLSTNQNQIIMLNNFLFNKTYHFMIKQRLTQKNQTFILVDLYQMCPNLLLCEVPGSSFEQEQLTLLLSQNLPTNNLGDICEIFDSKCPTFHNSIFDQLQT